MLCKTGLLIVSNPNKIGKILSKIQNNVKNTLYIQLLSTLSDPLGNFYPNLYNSWPKYSQTIFGIYSQAATHCKDLDVRVLLSGLKYNVAKIKTSQPIDLVIFDKTHSTTNMDNFITNRIENFSKNCNVLTLDSGDFEAPAISSNEGDKIFKHSVLGGTFDRLHIAHKLLLSEAALRSSDQVTVGVTEENMLQTKTLWELIEPIEVRTEKVADFLHDVCSDLKYEIVPINDPYGPSINDPGMGLIVVSQETLKGAEKINEIRKQKNLQPLEVKLIELIDEPNPNPIEEAKISSSTHRIRLLGTVINPIKNNEKIPQKPYIIGLTGGIASGKTNISKNLKELGAEIINCDLIAHDVYKAGKPTFDKMVEHFGQSIIGEDGEIDRKKVGPIVFKDPRELEALNNIVWPGIEKEVQEIINQSKSQVIVIEAAVLFNAGWERNCHEVWTTVVPRSEAIERLKSRNQMSEEQAKNRIESQPKNTDYVNKSNVVFCTLWPFEYTKQQVIKAWELLQNRIPS
ncbi:unnamed protein product [Brassicogethes aeneus]|uniref:Bifunctional coenzyme A synthase n=1 Tax=Brassicogethes aeneus TaxID=1431903 RepID=A0A9P0BHX2_BRAAE|nr:unnamed protein product [Brassicogethes aeneus]